MATLTLRKFGKRYTSKVLCEGDTLSMSSSASSGTNPHTPYEWAQRLTEFSLNVTADEGETELTYALRLTRAETQRMFDTLVKYGFLPSDGVKPGM